MEVISTLNLELELIKEIHKSKSLTVTKNQSILKSGDIAKFVPVVINGSLRVFYKDKKLKKEILLYNVIQNQICFSSYISVIKNNSSSVFIVAEKKSKLILISKKSILSWQEKYKSWNEFIIKNYINQHEVLLESIKNIGLNKIDTRLKKYLVQKSKNTTDKIIYSTHEFIANELGTSRVVISRILKKFEKSGKVELSRGSIKLKNVS
mgnify:FL=1